MLVYLYGFRNNIPLQDVSGVIQREIITSFLASVIQLFFWGSRLQLFSELILQCHWAPLGCSAVGDTAALPRACAGSIFRVLKPVLCRHEV